MKRTILSLLFILGIVSICDAQNLLPQPNKKGVWGYVNQKGKYVIKPSYQAASNFTSGLACVKINDAYGYINMLGQFVISPTFEFAEPFAGKYAKCRKNGRYGYIDTSGTTVIDFEFSDISPSRTAQYLIGRKENDRSVYIISVSSAKINRFDSVSLESHGGFYTAYAGGKVGYILKNGKVAISPSFLEKLSFSQYGIAISHKESGYGLVNGNLACILPEQYSFVKMLENGHFIYGNDETRFGLVSDSGKFIFRNDKYELTKILGDGKYIEAKKGDSTSILNLEGNAVVANCDSYSMDGQVLTYMSGKLPHKLNLVSGTMAITVYGKEIWTSDRASSIEYENPFVVWTDRSGKEHRMTTAGVAVFEQYDNVYYLSKGVYSVEKDGKQAVANAAGKILSEWVDAVFVIDKEYLQLIKKGGYGRNLYCAIIRGSNGKMITGWDFTWVSEPLANGLIPVRLVRGDNLSRKDKLLKMMGDNFYVVDNLSEGMYTITDYQTKKMGVMTEEGRIVVSPKYDEVGEFSCGMCRVWIAEKGNGFINKSGSLVIPCQYPMVLDFGQIEGVSNYTQVWDKYGYTYYIDKSGATVDSDKIMREAYDSQRRNSWY